MLKSITEKLMGDPTSQAPELMATSIVMYSTRYCPYCVRARKLLSSKGWSYEEIAVDFEPGIRAEMMEKSGRHTVPQIWIGDRHVGGCDDLFRLEVAGQLESMVGEDIDTGASNE